MSKTNSNAMTAILVLKLNNKNCDGPSDFGKSILELLFEKNQNTDSYYFEDGTHSSPDILKIRGKMPDIIVRDCNDNDKEKALIEVKVSNKETLQGSQKRGKEYQMAANANDLKLCYFIPWGYTQENELPEETFVKKIYWDKILSIAKKSDKTKLSDEIEYFCNVGDSVLTETDITLLKNKKQFIKNVNFNRELLSYAYEWIKEKKFKKRPTIDIHTNGIYFNKNIYWIGVDDYEGCEQFSVGFYHNGKWIYFPLNFTKDEINILRSAKCEDTDKQQIFSKAADEALKKCKALKRDNNANNSTYLKYSLIDNPEQFADSHYLNYKLLNDFVSEWFKEKQINGDKMKIAYYGSGRFFKKNNKEYWIGIDSNCKGFSIAYNTQEKDGENEDIWKYFPLDFSHFSRIEFNEGDPVKQHESFNEIADDAFKKAQEDQKNKNKKSK